MRISTAITGVTVLIAGGFAVSAPALAADVVPIVAPVEVVAPPPPPAFSWNGPYVGVFGVGLIFPACEEEIKSGASSLSEQEYCCWDIPNIYGAGAQLGFNVVRNSFLIGAEVQVGAVFPPYFEGPLFAVAANARAGFILGEKVLLYAEAGIGTTVNPEIRFTTVGGGVEFGIGDRLSLFGEVKAVMFPDGPIGGHDRAIMGQIGLNIHLGR
jgi:hypothetical protein